MCVCLGMLDINIYVHRHVHIDLFLISKSSKINLGRKMNKQGTYYGNKVPDEHETTKKF